MLKYRRDVDGLRALAVLPVVLFHFGVNAFPGGFTGVDIFFVISGYLISGTLLSDLEQDRFSVLNFYWRRFRRILPALAAVLFLSAIAAVIILLPKDLSEFSWSLIASATFWSNVYFWKSTNYFATEAALRPLLHTWSLAVEEQYYVFAPILIFVIYRWLGRQWVWTLLPIIIGSFAVSVMATTVAPTAGFYLLPTRVWELMLGALLMLHRWPSLKSRIAAEVVALGGLGLCAYGFFGLSESDAFPGVNALYPCLGTVLLIYAGQGLTEGAPAPLVTRFLMLAPMVWTGLVSYSLYLIHWPIIAYTRYVSLEAIGTPSIILMIVASFALAALSWRFVEQPFRRSRRLGGRRAVFTMSGVAIALMVALGAFGAVSNGLPGRFPGYHLEPIEAGDWHWGTCFNLGDDPLSKWNLGTCQLSHNYAGKVLLWGDSFAAQYVPALQGGNDRVGADVIQYTFAGCPPDLTYFSYARPLCSTFNRNVFKVIRESGARAVVMSARWVDYERRGFDGIQETVRRVRALGLPVTVIGQSPQFVTDVRKLDYVIRKKGVTDQAWTVAVDPEINRTLKAHTDGADFIDPLPFLCSGRTCSYAGPEGYYFSDYGHFSPLGAKRAVRLYWPHFGPPTSDRSPGKAAKAPESP